MSLIGTYKPYSYIVILCGCLWVTCHVDELLFDRQFSFYMKYFLFYRLTYMFFLYLCPVGTLLACYSVPRQVEGGCENET